MNETSLAKIAITKTADMDLDRMVDMVNEGFTGGRVTKNDLASWVIIYFGGQSISSCLKRIREDHFDRLVYLEAVIVEMKKARKEGVELNDIETRLAPILNKTSPRPRKIDKDRQEGQLEIA